MSARVMMESQQLSVLSSLRGEPKPEDYIQPHYKEAYRLVIDSLVCEGKDSYQKFLKEERIGSFLSEDELIFITTNARQPAVGSSNQTEEINGSPDNKSSTGTYWPVHSDVETPDLELGWPDVMPDRLQTNIDLLFHPPRLNNPTIKEVIRKHIQDARQVIAIVMDIFTDVDIFKEAVDASLRGVPVYVLLDDFHLQSFLSMAENQGIQIQKLRNMRVRTVKGQEYLCRSGARFNGAMEQKFLLVDCQTVVYGSYSFMWSFEKIHLSMVQVIKGQLVESYDEEFRTLYARSTVPAVLCPPEGLPDSCRQNGGRGLGKYASQSGQAFERKDQLRHTLDTVYRKACERQMGMREMEERLYEEEPFEQRLTTTSPGLNAQNHIHQFQSPDAANFPKRHSYAGDRQEGPYIPSQNGRFGASNWNAAGDGGYHNGRINCSKAVEDYAPQPQGNQLFRGYNMRQSYHGADKQVVSMKQNMPSLERTSKSFLRTWRIESYLNNADAPVGESGDHLQHEPPQESKAGPYMPSRVRSSMVFKSTIPEQPETNSYSNTSSSTMCHTDHSTVPSNGPHYSSMQWSPVGAMDSRARQEELILKRRSLLIPDDPRGNMCFGPVRDSQHSIYASLGRAKGGLSIRNPDILQDNWHKRHSVADPRSNIDYGDHRESSSHMYGGFARRQVERSTSGIDAQNGGYGLNLKEDQRSASQYNVKNVTDAESQPVFMWQEPPSRTVSTAALDVKSVNATSPRFLKSSSKKIRSMLNITEKKEVSPHSKDSGSPTIASDRSHPEPHMDRRHFADVGKPSTPRFSTEELRQGTPDIASSLRTQQKHTRTQTDEKTSLTSGNWRSGDRGGDNRLYSRFEPFCAMDKKPSSPSHTVVGSASAHIQVKPKNTLVTKGGSASEHHTHLGQPTHGHHENKLGKFIQRVGNFIHKNK